MFETYLQSQQLAPRTIKEIIKATERFENWQTNEGIDIPTYNDLLAYINSLDYSPQSKNQVNNALKHYFRYQIKEGKRTDNPALHLKIQGQRKKKYQILNREELDELFERYRTRRLIHPSQQTESHKRLTNLLGLIIYQALSQNEISKLQTEDFDLYEGVIQINATKRSNERKISLNQRQILPLAVQLEGQTGNLVKSRTNDSLRAISEHLKDIGYRQLTFQDIRASRICLWLKEHHIRKAQYLSGFKYVSSIEKYRYQDIEDLRERVNKFHPMN